jgi:hypothetical protein
MDRAIGMNRATVACCAEPLLFPWLLAHSLVRCQDFVPVLIGLLHRIHFALVFGTIRVGGLVAKTLGRGAGSEI